MMNRPPITTPKTMRQMTFADFHGNEEPPKLSPRRTMTVPPTMVRHPSQSNAFKPATSGVLGVFNFNVNNTSTKTSAVQGTA